MKSRYYLERRNSFESGRWDAFRADAVFNSSMLLQGAFIPEAQTRDSGEGPPGRMSSRRFPRHHLLDIREVNLDKFYLEHNDLLGCTLHLVWDSRSAGVGSICFLLFTLYHLMFLLCLWYHSFQMFLTSVQSSWCCGSNTYQLCPYSSFMPRSAAAGSHSSNSRRAAQA